MLDILLVVATFVVGIPLTFALHEFGHVLAARILRLRVYRVELGIGEPFATFRIGSTFVSMAWKPGGRVWSAANKLDGFSTRKAVVAGAGPLFSSALGISLIARLDSSPSPGVEVAALGRNFAEWPGDARQNQRCDGWCQPGCDVVRVSERDSV
ncbi:MAG: hypothetical protein GY811_07390 [Myxococcales bacterium]|nr:hypothetical protein [Myxococcales bacterium]